MYFLRHKSDAAEAFQQILADVSAYGTAQYVRPDVGGKFREGKFGDLRRQNDIRQEFTSTTSPEFNGIAERALGLTETTGNDARIHAFERYGGSIQLPVAYYLSSPWAEPCTWGCHALNCTATYSDKQPTQRVSPCTRYTMAKPLRMTNTYS